MYYLNHKSKKVKNATKSPSHQNTPKILVKFSALVFWWQKK